MIYNDINGLCQAVDCEKADKCGGSVGSPLLQAVRWLQTHGWPLQTRIWLCRNLSYPDETILCVSLVEALEISGFDSCVMVVME